MNAQRRKTGGPHPPIQVSEVKIRLLDDPQGNLLGWASCVVNESLFLNNIAIRRSREGKIFLTFPNQVSRSDKRHFCTVSMARSSCT